MDDVRGDFLGPSHGTTSAPVTANKISRYFELYKQIHFQPRFPKKVFMLSIETLFGITQLLLRSYIMGFCIKRFVHILLPFPSSQQKRVK